MSEHIYKKIELVGSSPEGIEQAVNNAVAKAGQSIRNMRWFEVAEIRGHLEELIEIRIKLGEQVIKPAVTNQDNLHIQGNGFRFQRYGCG